jgi:hypothetical protein
MIGRYYFGKGCSDIFQNYFGLSFLIVIPSGGIVEFVGFFVQQWLVDFFNFCYGITVWRKLCRKVGYL